MSQSVPFALSRDAADTWLFDLDNTLYPAASRLFEQVDQRISRFVAAALGLDFAHARARQKQFWHAHGTTLRGLMLEHQIDPLEYLQFVHDIDLSVLSAAPALDAHLTRLPGRKIVFTNADTPYAERVLHRLGIAHHFDGIFDIVAAGYLPKPDDRPYTQICASYAINPLRTVMFEDSARNLAPAHARGMGTVWVRSRPDEPEPENAAHYIHHRTDDLAGWLAELP